MNCIGELGSLLCVECEGSGIRPEKSYIERLEQLKPKECKTCKWFNDKMPHCDYCSVRFRSYWEVDNASTAGNT